MMMVFTNTNMMLLESRNPLRLPNEHPEIPPWRIQSNPLSLPPARHIILPFNLHKNPKEFYSEEAHKLLATLFPSTEMISFDNGVLVFHLAILPARPWPKTVAGVPCYFTTDPNNLGPHVPIIERKSRSNIILAGECDFRDNEGSKDRVFGVVRGFFREVCISITEIQYWGNFVVIVLEYEDMGSLTQVPKYVGGCPCYYLFESEMGRRPRKLSGEEVPGRFTAEDMARVGVDDIRYDILRPGILSSSDRQPDAAMSSGVLVQDSFGNRYMTTAAVPHTGKIYHPHGNGSDRGVEIEIEIGQRATKLPHCDIMLVKLNDHVQFTNEPFENTLIPTPAPAFKLTGFARATDTKPGSYIALHSPYTGFIEGIREIHSFLRIPTNTDTGTDTNPIPDPNSNPNPIPILIPIPVQKKQDQIWLKCQWNYMCQDSSTRLADNGSGIRGSPIWNSEGLVTGFFRDAPTSGRFRDWCLSVSGVCLVEMGYTIVID